MRAANAMLTDTKAIADCKALHTWQKLGRSSALRSGVGNTKRGMRRLALSHMEVCDLHF